MSPFIRDVAFAGIGGALLLTRGMARLLVGVTPTDSATFVAIVVLFGVVAAAASFVPARRAARVQPNLFLRES